MAKKKRRNREETFTMDGEPPRHAPNRSYPHLATEVANSPHYDPKLLFQLTSRLTPSAVRGCGVTRPDPRSLV